MTPRLLIGTTNPGKVRQMAGALATLDVECVPIGDVVGTLPEVVEHGDSAEAIAVLKALAYCALVGECVLSLDHWLTFDGVADHEQPRGHVRRIPGRPDGATDDELVEHIAALCTRHGGTLTGRWSLGVAVAGPGGVRSETVETVRTFVDRPSPMRMPGLPLGSVQVDVESGRYLSEWSGDEEDHFWQLVYGPTIIDLVRTSLIDLA